MNKKQNAKVVLGMALFGAVVFLGGCALNATSQGTQTKYLPVTVKFDANNCPIKADPELLDLTVAKKVVWKAVDSSGKPIEKKDYFSVHFDPFKGRELVSKNDGEIKSGSINKDAPSTKEGVIYKYTILGIECTGGDPLDPRFKLRR